MSEPNPIRVNMTVAESSQLVNMTLEESEEMFPMQHSEVVISTSTDYDDLFNKPQINGVELVGDKTGAELGLQASGDYATNTALQTGLSIKANTADVNAALAGKQNTIPDLADIRSGAELGETAVQQEVDPTVPAWAKAPTKPSYTASEVGALPSNTPIHNVPSGGSTGQVLTKSSNGDYALTWSTPIGSVSSVNGQTGAVVLDANDVGALPDSTTIPTKTSDLQNDSGYITGITSANVTTALGYTPYNATNPSGYVNSTQAANAAPVQSVNGQTGAVSLTIPTVPTNVSAFTNDSGYLTLSTLPIYNGGVS